MISSQAIGDFIQEAMLKILETPRSIVAAKHHTKDWV
jgi:hypothetical protein